MGEDVPRTREPESPEELFDGFPDSLELYRTVDRAVSALGPARRRTTGSQVAFSRRRGFAYVWRPGQYVANDVPAVLSLALPRQIVSDRITSVVRPSTNLWMHHLELRDPREVDGEVRAWLAEAWSSGA